MPELHQAEEAIRLLPCPWCGGIDLHSYGIEPHKHVFAGVPDHPGSHVIECAAAGCPAGCVAENEEAARAIWNRRPAQDADARDAARVDFHLAKATTWYPGRGQNGNGILCFDYQGRNWKERKEVQAPTWREAIDSAMAQARKEGGNG